MPKPPQERAQRALWSLVYVPLPREHLLAPTRALAQHTTTPTQLTPAIPSEPERVMTSPIPTTQPQEWRSVPNHRKPSVTSKRTATLHMEVNNDLISFKLIRANVYLPGGLMTCKRALMTYMNDRDEDAIG